VFTRLLIGLTGARAPDEALEQAVMLVDASIQAGGRSHKGRPHGLGRRRVGFRGAAAAGRGGVKDAGSE